MPRRRRPSAAFLLTVLGWLTASAVVLFLIGEAYRFTRSESSQLLLARHLGLGNPAHVTRMVGRQLRDALVRAGVEPDSIEERVVEGRDPPMVWRVGLAGRASRLQLNYLVTRALEKHGAAVISGREGWADGGIRTLTLQVGLPRRATHEVLVVQHPEARRSAPERTARIAVILFGLGDQPATADSFLRVPAPFGVALAPGFKTSREIYRTAHLRGREVVLHLPLEPINYPGVNPGPGTLLVTMKPARAAAHLRRYLNEAEPVTAVANHMGSLATQDMTLMRAVFHELKRSEMPFLHVLPAAGAVCKALAGDMGVSYVEPDMVIDQEARANPAALERRWKEALKRAHDRGRLIVWIRATRLTREWLPRALAPAKLDGASIVPLVSLVRSHDPI